MSIPVIIGFIGRNLYHEVILLCCSLILWNSEDGRCSLIPRVESSLLTVVAEEEETAQERESLVAYESARQNLLGHGEEEIGPEELLARKDALITWLSSHCLQVEEEGNIIKVQGTVTITPPYLSSCCCAPNEMVLSRVRKLVQAMPRT